MFYKEKTKTKRTINDAEFFIMYEPLNTKQLSNHFQFWHKTLIFVNVKISISISFSNNTNTQTCES